MDINVGIKLHNRFDIEVKDIITGQIVQTAYAENIVLDRMYDTLIGINGATEPIASYIHYGKGTGTLSSSRETLFSQLGRISATPVESVISQPPSASYGKKKIIIAPEAHVGEIITEVGVGGNRYLHSHAMLKDSEGNQISIGPKTETQEITIYATVFSQITLGSGMDFIIYNGYNALGDGLTGKQTNFLNYSKSLRVIPCNDKSFSNLTNNYPKTGGTGYLGYKDTYFSVRDSVNKKHSTPRVRFGSVDANGKIWSIVVLGQLNHNPQFLRMLFPNALWSGYHFEGKNIGTADGSKTKFVLPWSDINTSKQYDFYVDGAKKTAGTDYTLANAENETSITFAAAPANGLVVTGDWWVDYIPKDTDHVLDITFTITYGEGA